MFWKKFRGKLLHQASLGARVFENTRYRWLMFEGEAIQTCIHLKCPEKPVLPYMHQLMAAVRLISGDICLLGLGGGGVLHALAPYLNEESVQAVEASEEVIRLAKTYFMLERIPSLQIEHDDAGVFLEKSQGGYQHLLVDIFTEAGFPAHCSGLEFFKNCHRVLLDGGVLACNLVSLKQEWILVNHMRSVFEGATLILPIKNTSNVVVLAVKGGSILPLIEKLNLKKTIWDPQCGYIGFI